MTTTAETPVNTENQHTGRSLEQAAIYAGVGIDVIEHDPRLPKVPGKDAKHPEHDGD